MIPLNNSTSQEPACYLTDVLLLCTECRQPIRARINTQQWIRVEWIGPSGECLQCYQAKREAIKDNNNGN